MQIHKNQIRSRQTKKIIYILKKGCKRNLQPFFCQFFVYTQLLCYTFSNLSQGEHKMTFCLKNRVLLLIIATFTLFTTVLRAQNVVSTP